MDFTNYSNIGTRGIATDYLQTSSSSSSSSAPPQISIDFPKHTTSDCHHHFTANKLGDSEEWNALQALITLDKQPTALMNLTSIVPPLFSTLESAAESAPEATEAPPQQASTPALGDDYYSDTEDLTEDLEAAKSSLDATNLSPEIVDISEDVDMSRTPEIQQCNNKSSNCRMSKEEQATIALEILRQHPQASKRELSTIFSELSPPINMSYLLKCCKIKTPIEGSIQQRVIQEWNKHRSDRSRAHLVLANDVAELSPAEAAKAIAVARYNILIQIIENNPDQKKVTILELFAQRIGIQKTSCVHYLRSAEKLSKSDLGADWDRVNLARKMFLSLPTIKPDNNKFIKELQNFDRMLHLNPELNKTQITNEMTQNDSRKLAYFNIFLAKIRKKIEENEQPIHNGRSIKEIHIDYISRR
jgi:hypothetical protein